MNNEAINETRETTLTLDLAKIQEAAGFINLSNLKFPTPKTTWTEYLSEMKASFEIFKKSGRYAEFEQELERVENLDKEELLATLRDIRGYFRKTPREIRKKHNILNTLFKNFKILVGNASHHIPTLREALFDRKVQIFQLNWDKVNMRKLMPDFVEKKENDFKNLTEEYTKLLFKAVIDKIEDKEKEKSVKTLNKVLLEAKKVAEKSGEDAGFENFCLGVVGICDILHDSETKLAFIHFLNLQREIIEVGDRNVFDVFADLKDSVSEYAAFSKPNTNEDNIHEYRKNLIKYRFMAAINNIVTRAIVNLDLSPENRDDSFKFLKEVFIILNNFDIGKIEGDTIVTGKIPSSFLSTHELRAIRLFILTNFMQALVPAQSKEEVVDFIDNAWRTEEFKKLEALYFSVLYSESQLVFHIERMNAIIKESQISEENKAFIRNELTELEHELVVRDRETGHLVQSFESFFEKGEDDEWREKHPNLPHSFEPSLISHSEKRGQKAWQRDTKKAYKDRMSLTSISGHVAAKPDKDTNEEKSHSITLKNLDSMLKVYPNVSDIVVEKEKEMPSHKLSVHLEKKLEILDLGLDELVEKLIALEGQKDELMFYVVLEAVGKKFGKIDEGEFIDRMNRIKNRFFESDFMLDEEARKRAILYYFIVCFAKSKIKIEHSEFIDDFIFDKFQSLIERRTSFEKYHATWRPGIRNFTKAFEKLLKGYPEINKLIQNQIKILSWDISYENSGEKIGDIRNWGLSSWGLLSREKWDEALAVGRLRKQIRNVFLAFLGIAGVFGALSVSKMDEEELKISSLIEGIEKSEALSEQDRIARDVEKNVKGVMDLEKFYIVSGNVKIFFGIENEEERLELWNSFTESEREFYYAIARSGVDM